MKKTRSIQFLCSLLIGVIFMLVIFAGLMIYDRLTDHTPQLTFTTSSVEAVYDGTPLTNHQWFLVSGALKDGHKVVASFTGSQTNAGISENAMTVEIVDENGNIVTPEYTIRYQYGTLQVDHRHIQVDAETDFEGIPLINGQYTLTSDDIDLLDGHYAKISVDRSTDEMGLPTETITDVVIYDENGQDVTFNYQIYVREKGEAILIPTGDTNGGISTSLRGDLMDDFTPIFSVLSDTDGMVYFRTQSCGNYLGTGWDAAPTFPGLYNNTYAASYLTSFYLRNKNLKLHNMEIVPHIDAYPLPYFMAPGEDYEIQRNDTLSIGSTEQPYSVPFYLYDATSLTKVSSNDAFEAAYRDFVYENYTAIDQETLDYMNQIILEQGFSKNSSGIIKNVAHYIQCAATYNLDYNRQLDNEPNNAIAFLSKYREGVCRHYATAATLLFRALGFPARYTVGAVAELTADQWVDVTAMQLHAWVEVYIDGVGWIPVEVTGGPAGGGAGGGGGSGSRTKLELSPKPVNKRYDGTPLYSNGQISGMEQLERMGYTYSVSISGSQTEVGVSETTIDSITIYDPRGKDVTHSFEIVTKPGKLHVYLYELNLRTKSVTKTYDGLPYPASVSYLSQLQSGHRISRIVSTADPSVGIKDNSVEVFIADQNGHDITIQYLIRIDYGTLTINPAEITLRADSSSKKYDGTPLVCQSYIIGNGQLCNGHSFAVVEISGQQTQVGRCDNMIVRVVIVDADGNDVSANYSIVLLPGVLRVTYS